MKNKRREHGKIIEKFQESSQQAEVIRHDLIDTMEVSKIFQILIEHFVLKNKNVNFRLESSAKVNRQRN